jgi:hypothetical protein
VVGDCVWLVEKMGLFDCTVFVAMSVFCNCYMSVDIKNVMFICNRMMMTQRGHCEFKVSKRHVEMREKKRCLDSTLLCV